jgi:hypothetical protein
MDIKETVRKGVNWTHLAQDSDQWLAFVNMNMNFLVA